MDSRTGYIRIAGAVLEQAMKDCRKHEGRILEHDMEVFCISGLLGLYCIMAGVDEQAYRHELAYMAGVRSLKLKKVGMRKLVKVMRNENTVQNKAK